jgi:hypothetical protein
MWLLKKFWVLWFVEQRYSSMSKIFTLFTTRMAVIACLFVVCTQLLLLLLASMVWLAYLVLVGQGFSAEQAGLVLVGTLLALVATVALSIKRSFQETTAQIDTALHQKSSLSSAVTRITDSFLGGFNEPR